jgi:hypothetical protein
MRGLVTVLSLVIAIASAALLYGISYDTSELTKHVADLYELTAGVESDIAVLNAEKANLLRPARIERLASANLMPRPMTPAQLGRLEDLPWRGDSTQSADQAPVTLGK